MAVYPRKAGIAVSILSNGVPLQEYEDKDHASQFEANATDNEKYCHENTVSTYICIPSSPGTQPTPECNSGQQFAIKLEVGLPLRLTRTPKLGFHIYVDGNEVWESVCRKPDYVKLLKNNSHWEEVVRGVKVGKGRACRLLPFTFAAINTTEDAPDSNTVHHLTSRFQKVGVIEVHVYRQSAGKSGGETMGNSSEFAVGSSVPEKALKGEAKSHLTRLGTPQKVARGPVYKDMKNLDKDGRPFLIFRFLYRSAKALEQMLILKPPAESLVPDSESDSEESSDIDLNSEETKQLMLEWIKEKKQKARETKRAKANNSKVKKIKREQFAARGGNGTPVTQTVERALLDSTDKDNPIDLTGGDSGDEDEDLMFLGDGNNRCKED